MKYDMDDSELKGPDWSKDDLWVEYQRADDIFDLRIALKKMERALECATHPITTKALEDEIKSITGQIRALEGTSK